MIYCAQFCQLLVHVISGNDELSGKHNWRYGRCILGEAGFYPFIEKYVQTNTAPSNKWSLNSPMWKERPRCRLDAPCFRLHARYAAVELCVLSWESIISLSELYSCKQSIENHVHYQIRNILELWLQRWLKLKRFPFTLTPGTLRCMVCLGLQLESY